MSGRGGNRALLGLFVGGLALGGVAAWFVVGGGSGGRSGASYIADADLPLGGLRSPEVGAALLDVARQAHSGAEAPAPDVLAEEASRPVTVCGFRAPLPPVCRRAEAGESLAATVTTAARELRGAMPTVARLSVDVEVLEREVSWGAIGHRKRDPGVWGYRAGDAVLPPSHVLTRAVYGGGEEDKSFRPKVLAAELQARRVDPAAPPVTAEPLYRFRTVAWAEGMFGAPVHTYRLHAFERTRIEADVLAQRAAWAADHLASTVEPSGRVRYLYDPTRGEERPGYNLLRHGGTTYSLLQAYERFEHEPWLRASEAAIRYLIAHSRRDVRRGPFGGGETLWVDESRHVKLGGAGLALVMLTQHMQATGSDQYLEEARAYARFLVSQQQESGEFVYFASKIPGGEPRNRDSAYYPGEAILGLAQLYAIDPDPLWLDTAKRGADWLIDVRDAGKGPSKLANDHWLMIALSHLVRHTEDPRYVDHSKALAAAVAYQADRNRGKVASHPDYYGGYYDPPRSTPAATRGEGLVAVLDTCALVGESCDDIRQLLRETVTHELWAQYTPNTLWWAPTPGAIVGGFSGGIMDPDLRNDFTQHNLSSVLGTERHLRSPDVALPGGPTWSWERQATFDPPGPRPIEQLLAPLRSIRGEHRWDLAGAARDEVPEPSPTDDAP